MDIHLGRFPAQLEQPETIKFAWPVVLIPELFTNRRHLAVLLGSFSTIGWEAYALVLDSARAALQVAGGAVTIAAIERSSPRLIVAGDRDQLVPLDAAKQFAAANVIAFRELPGRGHWLIGGRALERAMGEAHR